MKRIVNGVTYNTDTSRLLAQSTWVGQDDQDVTGKLYQTRGGAFFEVDTWTEEVWVERLGTTEPRERTDVVPKSADAAQKWLLEGDVEVFDNPFGDPPEAEAESEPGSTVYVRVPPALKRTIDQEAGKAKLSTNTWAMKCMERCLSDSEEGKKSVSLAWHFAKSLQTEAEEAGRKFEAKDLLDALDDIADVLEKGAEALWGTDDFSKIADVSTSYEVDRFRRSYLTPISE